MHSLLSNAKFCRTGSEVRREILFHSLILFTVCKPRIQKGRIKDRKKSVSIYYIPNIYITSLIYMKVYPTGKTQGRGNMKRDTNLYGNLDGK